MLHPGFVLPAKNRQDLRVQWVVDIYLFYGNTVSLLPSNLKCTLLDWSICRIWFKFTVLVIPPPNLSFVGVPSYAISISYQRDSSRITVWISLLLKLKRPVCQAVTASTSTFLFSVTLPVFDPACTVACSPRDKRVGIAVPVTADSPAVAHTSTDPSIN